MKEIRIGTSSAPYLADHGFQDMTVLPGSFYLETALSMESGTAAAIRNVVFQNPIILSPDDCVVKIEVKDRGDDWREYTFYEANSQQCAARLEIEHHRSMDLAAGDFSVEQFRAQSEAVIDAGSFYKRLRKNGNQYGPEFQRVAGIWRRGDQHLGRICTGKEVNACSLDAMTQLLAPFVMEEGKTFILKSIQKIEVNRRNLPDTLWGRAVMRDGGLGDVCVFDESGNLYLALSGVAFSLLDGAEEKSELKLVVAANFTAEPLEDSLKFWGDYFSVATNVEFAPYNQVFQQLLDPSSAFHKNGDGVNVILLRLGEWASRASAPAVSLAVDKQKFAGRPTYVLPNGVEIVQLNEYETDYVYKEIFEDQAYLCHGIRLDDGDTVVDIGANIGLFSLFVMSRCKNPKIYAFEPAPLVHELLKCNCEAYGSNAITYNCGVSDRARTATFTFYEKSSVFSGFHSDESEDRTAIQTVVRNMLNGEADEYVEELTADRLRHSVHEVQLISVSDIIRQNQIERLNLLKIDAERSELDILKGIDEWDWPKIDQIVIEVHDRTGELVKRIQELLTERGFRCAIEEEKLLEHSGLCNLFARRVDAREEEGCDLTRNVRDFCTALRAVADHSTVPMVLCLAPARHAVNNAEALLLEAGRIPNVHVISSSSLLQRYPVRNYYDPDTHRAGHIPYTAEGFTAIGTALMRRIFNLKSNPFKVIVLDCDNTLWKGVCGEDGPHAIEPHCALQEFMIDRAKAGMLLCLCSKNNEADALAVFDQRSDMPLKREHLVAWRLNWDHKSVNIKSLAEELNVGLDSFIFIDDNPVDCADVRIHCPGVLTLQLPSNPEMFPTFLNHIWAFDRSRVTVEDQDRARMYQENAARKKFREQTLSLKHFIDGLQLQIEITEATEDQLARVSQLTFRTNQFNFTTIRRSEAELRDFLKRQGAKCFVIRVSDRFGDYGQVGVLLCESEADRYKVDTFLLSCRVLGRGVEHRALSWLGQHAKKGGIRFVELTYVPTEKNSPALEFIKSLPRTGVSWTFPSEELAALSYDPDRSIDSRPIRSSAPIAARSTWRLDGLQQIGESLYEVSRISTAIEEYRLKSAPSVSSPDVAASSPLETALLSIWRKTLGSARIGLDDNFFEAGGTSLKAVQVIAAIKKELRQTVSIVSLFECPTISLLAAKLGGDIRTESATSGAAARGQRRRYNTRGRAAAQPIA